MNGNKPTGRSGGTFVRAPRTDVVPSPSQLTPEQDEMFAILRATPRVPGTVLAAEYRPLFQDVIDELFGQQSSVPPMLLKLSKSTPVVTGGTTSVTVTIQVTQLGNPVDSALVRLRSSGTEVSPQEVTTVGGSAQVTWSISQIGDFALIAEAIDCGKVAAYDVVPIHVTAPE